MNANRSEQAMPKATRTADPAPGDRAAGAGSAARPKRADAVRNVARLVAAAREAFAANGPTASLDDIARAAGVGPGTLYRHFPTRLAILEAVYRDVVDELCAEGDRLLVAEPPADALVAWLRWFVGYVGEKHGLAAALSAEGSDRGVFAQSRGRIFATGGRLLDRAKATGAVRPDVGLGDVIALANAIAQAGERSTEGQALSERLLRLAVEGLRSGQPRDDMDAGPTA